jgi:dTDP-4-amino-4,6-dideoxygalactose transaminase
MVGDGIEVTLGTYAMHAQPAFARYGWTPGDLPNSLRAQQQSLTLPLWPGIPEELISRVVDCLRRAVGRT